MANPIYPQEAQRIAETYSKDVVLLISIEHAAKSFNVTTYGKSAKDKVVAKSLGAEVAQHLTGGVLSQTHAAFDEPGEAARNKQFVDETLKLFNFIDLHEGISSADLLDRVKDLRSILG